MRRWKDNRAGLFNSMFIYYTFYIGIIIQVLKNVHPIPVQKGPIPVCFFYNLFFTKLPVYNY